MYDKYTQLINVNAGTTKLQKNKGLLITNITTTSGLTLWAYSGDPSRPALGATYNIPLTYASPTVKQDIFPVEVYAVTAISGLSAYLLT